MKEGDSWADGLGGTREKTEGSRSVMETVEKREEDSCYCVERTLLSAHRSPKSCAVRHRSGRRRLKLEYKSSDKYRGGLDYLDQQQYPGVLIPPPPKLLL